MSDGPLVALIMFGPSVVAVVALVMFAAATGRSAFWLMDDAGQPPPLVVAVFWPIAIGAAVLWTLFWYVPRRVGELARARARRAIPRAKVVP